MAFHPNEGQSQDQVHSDKADAKVERAFGATALPTEKVLADIMPPKLGADQGTAAHDERLGEGPGKFIKLASFAAAVTAIDSLTAKHTTMDNQGNVQEAFWPFTSSSPSPPSDQSTKCQDKSSQNTSDCPSNSGAHGTTVIPRAGTPSGGSDRGSTPSDEGPGGTRGGTPSEGAAGEGAHGSGAAGEGAHGGFGGAHAGGGGE